MIQDISLRDFIFEGKIASYFHIPLNYVQLFILSYIIVKAFSFSYSLSEGLVAYHKFDAGEGNVAYDYSGNNNHGLIYGATWSIEKIGGAS